MNGDRVKENILLIRPPTINKGTSFIATQFPLNLAGIAAFLIKKGHHVRIWDFDVEPFSESDFGERLKKLSPFIVGISCYTPTIINGHNIAAYVKKYLPKAIVVAGGPHLSALPKETLDEFQNFDIGVIGEGEETMGELSGRLLRDEPIEDIAGIVYRKNGSSHVTARRDPIKDLDSLPLPARHLLDVSRYKGHSHRGFSRSFLKITEIMTSRGCPNRCIFCASDVVMGCGVRFKSADRVNAEISECIEKYAFNHFTISDDTFILKEDRLYRICEEFAKRKVSWNCNARVWPISKKMLSVMAKSGCIGISFGVESGSQRILDLIKKNITVEQVEEAFRLSKEAGIKLVEANVIIGSHPSETKEDVALTQKLLNRISPDVVMISIVVPYPGTELYNIMKNTNLMFDSKDWDSFVLFGKEPSWKTEHFGPKELVRLQKKMIARFYFRPIYIAKMIRKIRNPKELIYWLRGGKDFLLTCIRGK